MFKILSFDQRSRRRDGVYSGHPHPRKPFTNRCWILNNWSISCDSVPKTNSSLQACHFIEKKWSVIFQSWMEKRINGTFCGGYCFIFQRSSFRKISQNFPCNLFWKSFRTGVKYEFSSSFSWKWIRGGQIGSQHWFRFTNFWNSVDFRNPRRK